MRSLLQLSSIACRVAPAGSLFGAATAGKVGAFHAGFSTFRYPRQLDRRHTSLTFPSRLSAPSLNGSLRFASTVQATIGSHESMNGTLLDDAETAESAQWLCEQTGVADQLAHFIPACLPDVLSSLPGCVAVTALAVILRGLTELAVRQVKLSVEGDRAVLEDTVASKWAEVKAALYKTASMPKEVSRTTIETPDGPMWHFSLTFNKDQYNLRRLYSAYRLLYVVQSVYLASYMGVLALCVSQGLGGWEQGGVASFVDLTRPDTSYLLPVSAFLLRFTANQRRPMDLQPKSLPVPLISVILASTTAAACFFFNSALALYWCVSAAYDLTLNVAATKNKRLRDWLRFDKTILPVGMKRQSWFF